MTEKGAPMENWVTEFYKTEVERMEKLGYTPEQIKKGFDSLLYVQNMVAMAVMSDVHA